MLWTGAIPIVTSLSTVALYAAYIVPVALALRARRLGNEWARQAVWTLGRWGAVGNTIAIAYTVFICTVLVMPPNQLAGMTFGGMMLGLCVLWFAGVRKRYRGPAWSES
jgi:hypothetical protein